MPKQTPLVIGALVILALVGVVGFTQLNKSPKTTQPNVTKETAGDESSAKGTIKSLLGMGKNVSCTFSYLNDQGETKGTVYVSGEKKMRGDFTTVLKDQKEMDSHMIQDATWSYFWSGSSAQGTKIKVEDVEEASPNPTIGPTAEGQTAADLDKEVDYKCSAWNVDNSKFTPPANVQFTDMSQMMKQGQQMMQSPGVNDKSACAAISDPTAKAACESATSGY